VKEDSLFASSKIIFFFFFLQTHADKALGSQFGGRSSPWEAAAVEGKPRTDHERTDRHT
jgi:hypothetical protein